MEAHRAFATTISMHSNREQGNPTSRALQRLLPYLTLKWINTIILRVAKATLTLNQPQGRAKGFDLSANASSATCKKTLDTVWADSV